MDGDLAEAVGETKEVEKSFFYLLGETEHRHFIYYSAVQKQTAVTAYFSNEQLLLFAISIHTCPPSCHLYDPRGD